MNELANTPLILFVIRPVHRAEGGDGVDGWTAYVAAVSALPAKGMDLTAWHGVQDQRLLFGLKVQHLIEILRPGGDAAAQRALGAQRSCTHAAAALTSTRPGTSVHGLS